MHLYLVQHAESMSKEQDPDRPLTEKGLADINRMARYAASHLAVDIRRILHSGKLRAQQTAEILAEHLSPPDGIESANDLDPLAEPSAWAKRLNESDENIMLVGHLPHLARLASVLLGGDQEKTIIAFRNAGVVCLAKDDSGDWSIRWMVIPDII